MPDGAGGYLTYTSTVWRDGKVERLQGAGEDLDVRGIMLCDDPTRPVLCIYRDDPRFLLRCVKMTCAVNSVSLSAEHMSHLLWMCSECDTVNYNIPLMSTRSVGAFCRRAMRKAFVMSPNLS